jgi:hypothetical protein
VEIVLAVGRHSVTPLFNCLFDQSDRTLRLSVAAPAATLQNICDIAGTVASITEDDPGVESEKSPKAPLVDRDSVTRWARRLGVQSDVDDFSLQKRS